MSVCQICGDVGYSNLLLPCVHCKIIAAHRYCIDNPTILVEEIVNWSCEECAPKKIVLGLQCRKKAEEETALQKASQNNRKKNKGHPIAGSPNGALKASQVTSSVSNSNLKIKEGTTRIKQVDLRGENSHLFSSDSDHIKNSASATVKGTDGCSMPERVGKRLHSSKDTSGYTQEMLQDGTLPEQLKQSLDDKKSSSDVLSRGKKSTEISASATGKGIDNCSMPQHADKCLLSYDDCSGYTQEILLDGTPPRELKQSTDIKKDTSGGISIGKKSENLNADNGVKQGIFEPVHVTSQEKKDMTSSETLGDQHLKMGKNVGCLAQKDKDCVTESTSSMGENVHGDSGLAEKEKYVGPPLPKKKVYIVESTSKAEEGVGAVSDLDKRHKDEQLSDEPQSQLKKKRKSFKKIAQPAKVTDCTDDKKSEVIEEPVADFVLDRQDDVQSHCDTLTSPAPRKRRRLIIEMEYSDDEPVVVVAKHPSSASDVGEDPLLMSKSVARAQEDRTVSDVLQPSPLKLDSHVCVQESPRVISNHPSAQPSPMMYNTHIPAQPLIEAAWRGHCSINEGEHPMSLRLDAHLSNKAHAKVQGAASALPDLLNFDFVPKKHTWPKRFEESPPTGDSIGLYFFPVDERGERVYRYLIGKMIEHCLILRSYINNLELLIICSRELPQGERSFRRNYFLWGVFKPRKELILPDNLSDIHTGNVHSTLPNQCLNGLGTTHAIRDSDSIPGNIDGRATCSLDNYSKSRVRSEAVERFAEWPQASALKPSKQAYEYDRQGHSSHREHSRKGSESNRRHYSERPRKPWRSQDREYSRRDSEFSRAKEQIQYDSQRKSRRYEHMK